MDTAVQLGGRREARGARGPSPDSLMQLRHLGAGSQQCCHAGRENRSPFLKGRSPTHHPPLTIRMGPWLESFLGTLVPI